MRLLSYLFIIIIPNIIYFLLLQQTTFVHYFVVVGSNKQVIIIIMIINNTSCCVCRLIGGRPLIPSLSLVASRCLAIFTTPGMEDPCHKRLMADPGFNEVLRDTVCGMLFRPSIQKTADHPMISKLLCSDQKKKK